MKRLGWGMLAVILLLSLGGPAEALDTSPSSSVTVRINGPLMITGYSFSGQALRYVQVYNVSDQVVALDGWRVASERAGTQTVYASLAGNVAPANYFTVAHANILPSATFTYSEPAVATDPILSSLSLLPPAESQYSNEVVLPTVVTSTPRIAGTPAIFYYARNVSATTGSYLTTFAAFIPSSNFTVVSDELYYPPLSAGVSVVEVYPDAATCAPFETTKSCNDYVKLRNDTMGDIDLSGYRLRTGTYGQSSTASNTVRLEGELAAGHYTSIPMTLSASGAWVWLEDAYGTIRYEQTLVGYPSSSGYDGQAWSYDDTSDTWKWTIYPTPSDEPNRFEIQPPINSCQGLLLSEIAANVTTEDQFIEIKNASGQAADLTGCALQTNRSANKNFIFGSEGLAAGAYRTVYIKDTELTLTKTTSGSVYLLSSDLKSEQDQVDYDSMAENTAWARVGDAWLQTHAPTPDADNAWLEYPPCGPSQVRNTETGQCIKLQLSSAGLPECGEGKVRNNETNRCRTIEAAETGVVPCEKGQYRNPETNRCRSLLTTASVLTPCASNQERNPETNRCRSIAADTELKPCAPNQERNPDTNRCRNKTSSVAADFPVEAVAQSSEATLGWWAFGGVGLLAAGYAGWEWRREVASWIGKVMPFGIGRS